MAATGGNSSATEQNEELPILHIRLGEEHHRGLRSSTSDNLMKSMPYERKLQTPNAQIQMNDVSDYNLNESRTKNDEEHLSDEPQKGVNE